MKDRPSYVDMITRLSFHHDKMAFLTGPRQVGKTTLAQYLLSRYGQGQYCNWDDVAFRRQWIKDPKSTVPQTSGVKPLVVYDELHKAPRWKSYLKGVYDMRRGDANILVTGSAKLDIFRRGGDSLLGRYFQFRLHPFSAGELTGFSVKPNALENSIKDKLPSKTKILETLSKHGGFPEPYLKADTIFTNLWRRTRMERLMREDLRDLTHTHEVPLIEACAALIPERIGSPFSIQSLAEDVDIKHPTAKRWLLWLSQLYYIYFIPPYSKKIARSLKKQPKVYLWDWSEVFDIGARFENMVASHLLKAVHFWTDSGIGNFELYYVRDKEKREVDFLVVRDLKPWVLIETQIKESAVSSSFYHYAKLLKPKLVIQVVAEKNIHKWFEMDDRRGQVISADAFLPLLP